MNSKVRVRYAPSPTGIPHVGNIRTALFNWLFARRRGGSFILRIEDTDRERLVPGAYEAIMASLRWLGLDWDEGPEVGGDFGPYLQSERLGIYQPIARGLVEQGHAYYCCCTPQRLEEMRAEQQKRREPPRYDRRCRDLTPEQRAEMEAGGTRKVVRFRTPLEGQTKFLDEVRGEVVFDNSTLDDFVLLKSDGYPTYHLANVIDDHLMQVSHVMRADEWLSSTPRHVLLYSALGWEPPQFAHLPMILGPDRSKLSKRHGATSLLEYRDRGYLPESMMNFLALLGWSLDDHTELFTREDLMKLFSLERIGKTGAIFSLEKLDWMNGVYMRGLSLDDFVARALPFLDKGLPPEVARPLPFDYVKAIAPLVQERVRVLGEIAELTEFFFADSLSYDVQLLLGKKLSQEQAREALRITLDKLRTLESFDTACLEEALRPLAADLGLKTGDFFGLLRIATTGRTAAPPLFQTMAVLGRERCLKRLHEALARVS